LPTFSTVRWINVSAGGVPKLPVAEARLTRLGVEGDRQRNRRFHGGPQRAVCLYSLDRIQDLIAEGHPIAPGTVGENITVEGLDWATVVPGVSLVVGEAELQVTSYATPCKTIRKSFKDGDIERIDQDVNPGWSRVYAKVLKEGLVRRGDAVVLASPEQASLFNGR
jgi:MOSC domain-containing protein YiiM